MSRPRLLSLLGEIRDYRLVLISAPTGYGKTTLLTDFARSQNMALCWYTLDENDRDVAVFCRYLLHSVRQVYPDFGKSFEELLGYNLEQLHQEAIVNRLAEEFVANLEQLQETNTNIHNFRETLLVIDDFQFAESLGVSRFVKHLVSNLPDDYHLILSSRKRPEDLPVIKLTAKQLLMGIGQEELAFTVEEVGQLLREYYNLEEPKLAETLASFSEGWITGVVLALGNQSLFKSGKWREITDKNSSNPDFDTTGIFDYLAQEVLATQPLEFQDFLLKTSVFEVMKPGECDALLDLLRGQDLEKNSGFIRSEVILQQLESRNLFIIRLQGEKDENDQEEDSFQYHSLFRQFLLSRLKQNKNLYQATQLQAGIIAQKEGSNNIAAVQHFLAADEISQAAVLLNQIAEPLYAAGHIQTMADLLDGIPVQAQASLPHLLNMRARLLVEKSDNEAAIKIYAQVEKIYQQEGANDFAAMAMANQAQLLARIGHRLEANGLCNQLLRHYGNLMHTTIGQKAVAYSKYVLATAAIEQGNIAEAEQNLREAAEIYKVLEDDYHLAAIDNSYGQLYQFEGRLVKSSIYFDRTLAFSLKVGNRIREAYSRTSIATNLYLQGNYQESEKQLYEVMVLTERWADHYLQIFVLAYLGNVYRDTERFRKADETYTVALQLAHNVQVRRMELLILNDQATSYILQNRKEEARSQISLSLELAEEYNLPERAGLSYLNLGWLEFESRAFKRAFSEFEKSLGVFVLIKARPEEARLRLGVAVALMALGEPKKALLEATESLEMTQLLGYEPYLPFELVRATSLFEYVARKKVTEPIEEFLRKRGFLTNFEIPQKLSTNPGTATLSTTSDFLQPIILAERVTKNTSKAIVDSITTANSTILKVYGFEDGRVLKGNFEIKQWRTSKAREALFYLLENNGCSRDQLYEALWPDESPSFSPNLLNSNLTNLRKAIAPVEIKYSSGRYFVEGAVWYDAGEFNTEMKAIMSVSNFDVERLTKTLNLYKKDFFSQCYSNWCLERQQQLLLEYTLGLSKLAQYHYREKDYPTALLFCQQLLRKDSYNENIYEIAIDCLIQIGSKAEAHLLYEKCCKALGELDLKPTSQLTLLLKKFA